MSRKISEWRTSSNTARDNLDLATEIRGKEALDPHGVHRVNAGADLRDEVDVTLRTVLSPGNRAEDGNVEKPTGAKLMQAVPKYRQCPVEQAAAWRRRLSVCRARLHESSHTGRRPIGAISQKMACLTR